MHEATKLSRDSTTEPTESTEFLPLRDKDTKAHTIFTPEHAGNTEMT